MLLAANYPMGTAARMGPGYFPRGLGGMLVFLGALVALKGLRSKGEAVPRFYFTPLFLVLSVTVAFGILVPYTGVVIGGIAMVFIASIAHYEFNWRGALIAGVVLAAAAVFIFVLGLGVQLPIWPKFVYTLWPTTFHR
jgi:hypothetical protein